MNGLLMGVARIHPSGRLSALLPFPALQAVWGLSLKGPLLTSSAAFLEHLPFLGLNFLFCKPGKRTPCGKSV